MNKYINWFIMAFIGAVFRIWVIGKISVNDNYYEGKMIFLTDIDYKVYLDASLYDSPYQRHTYRYSPILAQIMAPSYTYDQNFGKYLLVAFDVLSCFLLFKIHDQRGGKNDTKGGMLVSGFIYTHPFLMYLSIRGSCEGITMSLAWLFYYLYFSGTSTGNMTAAERREKGIVDLQPCRIRRYLSYAVFGLWVHFRVFPIILVPMLIMYEFYSVKMELRLRHTFKFILEFGLISGGVFIALSVYYYILYGYDFLHETYFYHLTRRDNRHSRSVYFYDIYLNYWSDSFQNPLFRMVMRNLPNISFIGFFSFYLTSKRSLFFCQGFLMLYFVLYNRVITDQYYMWMFGFMYLMMSEWKMYQEGRWVSLYCRAFLIVVMTAIPVGLWILGANKMQECSKTFTMLVVWCWNLVSLISQISILSQQFISLVDQQKTKTKQIKVGKQQAKRVKND